MSVALTPKQSLVFSFVRYRVLGGLPPSVADIAEHCRVSKSRAYQILKALEKKGYVHRPPRKRRAICLLPPHGCETRYSLRVETSLPELGICKGDFLVVDTDISFNAGEVVVSAGGEIKPYVSGEQVFGKVVSCSRIIR